MKKIILTLLLSVVILGAVIFAGGIFSIYYAVWKTCNSAKENYGGKCQPALVKVLEDEKTSPKGKNDAIWALGQMAEPESLAPLEKIYAGKVPEGREPLNEVVSQYEIEKAIRWVKNGNITSWMYFFLKK